MNDLRYPVGERPQQISYSSQEREVLIQTIEDAPENLARAVADFSISQLDTPYREGGWTVCEVVHHMADSHINGFVRMKLALTEDTPTISTYERNEWPKLADSRMPIDASVMLLTALHARWTVLLRSILDQDWTRAFRNPQTGLITLEQALAIYDWHSRHHVAHITGLRERIGW
jgi:DinB superfamily